jgi:hypothetical protein
VSRYDVDGFFFNWFSFNEFDYSYRYRGVCHCEACILGFAAATGGGVLPDGPEDAQYPRWLAYSNGVLDELTMEFRAHVAAVAPGAGLILGRSADIMFHEANNALGRELWPAATGDGVSAFKTRRPDVPVLVNAVAFIDMPYRLASEQPEQFEGYLISAIARGANPSTYIMGVPGDIPYAMLDAAARVTRFHRDHEELYAGLRPGSSIALVRPAVGRTDVSSHGQGNSEYRGIATALQELHRPVDVIDAADLAEIAERDGLARFTAIILPDIGAVPEGVARALDDYAADGGAVIATGSSAVAADGGVQLACLPAVRLLASHRDPETLKNSYVGAVGAGEDVAVRQSTALAPVLGVYHYYTWTADHQTRSRLVSQAPFGPPEKTFGHRVTGHPGSAVRRHGSGLGVLLPWSVGHSYQETALTVVRDEIDRVLREVDPTPAITAALPEQIELILGRVEGRTVLHLINRSGLKRRGYGPIVPISGGSITVAGRVRQARAHVADISLDVVFADGTSTITLPEINRFEVVTVE